MKMLSDADVSSELLSVAGNSAPRVVAYTEQSHKVLGAYTCYFDNRTLVHHRTLFVRIAISRKMFRKVL